MKKLKYIIMIFISSTVLFSCSSKTNSSQGTNNNISTTNYSTATEDEASKVETTAKPVMTSTEKCEILNSLGEKFEDDGGDIEILVDEFTKDTNLIIPEDATKSIITGDNNETLVINSTITQSGETDTDGTYGLFIFYMTENTVVYPEKLYIKTSSNSLVISDLEETSYDVSNAYASQTYFCKFSFDEFLELENMLRSGEEIRMRISGDSTIDFTLDKINKDFILDSVDLYKEFIKTTD